MEPAARVAQHRYKPADQRREAGGWVEVPGSQALGLLGHRLAYGQGTVATMALPKTVTIVEVGPRDGLQNESGSMPTASKVELVQRIVAAGTRRIETVSFVHPGLVPQMADAEAVMDALGPSPGGVAYIGLVLNRRGLERALLTPVDEVNLVVSATEGFSQANQGASVEDTMREIEAMVPLARSAGLDTTVTISVAFGCPYEGEVRAAAVTRLAARAAAVEADEIALGDTIGVAAPSEVVTRVEAVRQVSGDAALRCHFHDTRNTAVANVYAALSAGVEVIDASVGGAGGCPFAPNATGNVPTEDVLYTLGRMGIHTGIDLDATISTGMWLGRQLGVSLPAALAKAGPFPS
jgi:hydroxymethylglutaryl-CoA lyase